VSGDRIDIEWLRVRGDFVRIGDSVQVLLVADGLERLSGEVKRRTDVASILPNEDTITALLPKPDKLIREPQRSSQSDRRRHAQQRDGQRPKIPFRTPTPVNAGLLRAHARNAMLVVTTRY
jgi:hypothetical protein